MLLLGFVVAGMAIGLLRGGSLRGLSNLEFRFGWLIVLALVVQMVLFCGVLPDAPWVDTLTPRVNMLSHGAIVTALALNLRLWPVRLVTLGALANFAAIVGNGGYMPTTPDAVRAAGLTRQLETLFARGHLNNSTLINEHTRLPYLADIFAVPAGVPLANVFSVGDVAIGLGALLLVVQAMEGGNSRPWFRRRFSTSLEEG